MRKENADRDAHNVLVQVAFSAGAMLFPLVYLFSLRVLGKLARVLLRGGTFCAGAGRAFMEGQP